MTENYSPGPGVLDGNPLSTVLLSQRDLGLRVPLNFVTSPGVSLSSACFSQRIYEDDEYAECFSNLLAVGFRRFEIDLYWDENRRVWSFCPAEVSDVIVAANVLSTSKEADKTSISLESLITQTESTERSASVTSPSFLNVRQISTEESSSQTTIPSPTGTSLGTNAPSVSSLPETPDDPIVDVGNFVCTRTINLSTFTSQLLDYITKTENTLGARMLYVIVNIHASSRQNTPNQPASKPLALPEEDELVGSLFSGNLSQYIYQPSQLFADRSNLNRSWYSVDYDLLPIDGYYSTTTNASVVSTEDGWPSEAYVEFSKSERLLLGWGTVDPQMEEYNFIGDSATIFQKDYISKLRSDVLVNGAGQLTSGCFLRGAAVELSQVNSSWAFASTLANFLYPTSLLSDLTPLLSLTGNLTNCGISPHLNVTLLNTTATQNPNPYSSFVNSTIWSWSPLEPLSNPLKRCASSTSITGRWTTTACDISLRAACRHPSSPYNWTLTSYSIDYPAAVSSCPSPYNFAVPRTSLENAYLTQRMRAEDNIRGNGEETRVWLDFNAIDADACWVSGGANATCPYVDVQGRDAINRRTLLVALIAAIIVLVITALTIFVMCAGNRKISQRTRKRKKRAADNMYLYYEGVPS